MGLRRTNVELMRILRTLVLLVQKSARDDVRDEEEISSIPIVEVGIKLWIIRLENCIGTTT